jgi:uncharacterized protein (DUF305 family)
MIPHHESAVQMAAIASGRAGSDFVRELATNPFDAAFIKMMIPHHEGAIEMAREELDKGKDPELRGLAQDIIDAQQREIDQMIEHSRDGESAGGHGGHDG